MTLYGAAHIWFVLLQTQICVLEGTQEWPPEQEPGGETAHAVFTVGAATQVPDATHIAFAAPGAETCADIAEPPNEMHAPFGCDG